MKLLESPGCPADLLTGHERWPARELAARRLSERSGAVAASNHSGHWWSCCGWRAWALRLIIAWFIALPLISGSAEPLARRLDSPLLFVKRHPYFSDHIYDDYYTWHPGGGIYVIENPWAPVAEQTVRPVIDPSTPETLGEGVYRDPDISFDGRRVLFAFKGRKDGDSSIYEIGLNGRGLRQLTRPEEARVQSCTAQPPPRAMGHGRHDISPAYLPDGRIVFTSTRQGSRVPCFNSESDNLHVMSADGSGLHSITVNNVTEFDPSVLPDGRILYGRWEYVDKTALYMQSLWTANPDGSGEAAFFGNNMAKPTAFLDARPVPGSHLVVASLTPHNGQSVGAIAMIDTRLGKNGLQAIHNFTPEYPTEMDQGVRRGPCDPWPLDANTILIANNATHWPHGVLQIIARDGRREVLHAESHISCYSPMLVKARPVPPVIEPAGSPGEPGRFLVQDIYSGLDGVKRGEITQLRVLEETARISGIPDGGRWWNQAFLVSWQGSYTVKNFLGVVPVEPDGSAFFEAPAGKALYFQALDRNGRLVQSMRTFVQAVPGATRSCVGCHETKSSAPAAASLATPSAATRVARMQPEPWGSGFLDYPATIQPILDRHCVRCHGGKDGIAAGVDLGGGWTWAFNLSYETLLKNTLSGFVNCVNEAVKTSEILPPRTHGSGVAPLTRLVTDSHAGYTPQLSIAERAAVLAWMDGNCNYYGTWNWSETATCEAVLSAGAALAEAMHRAGCVACHEPKIGNDWINLQTPELSRILRAPLDTSEAGGLGWCRERKAPQVFPLVKSAAQPPDVFKPHTVRKPDSAGAPAISYASLTNAHYREMLAVIRRARAEALAAPRVDMPGAVIQAGECRQLVSSGLPPQPPALRAFAEADSIVRLEWSGTAEFIGLTFEVHRADLPGFVPAAVTLIGKTPGFQFTDLTAPAGQQHYALVPVSQSDRQVAPARCSVNVPELMAPPPPDTVKAVGRPGEISLEWETDALAGRRFEAFRSSSNANFTRLTTAPIATPFFTDTDVAPDVTYRYAVRAVSRREVAGWLSSPAAARALPENREPVFAVSFQTNLHALISGGLTANATRAGAAHTRDGLLDLRDGGHVTFSHRAEFDVRPRLTVECWVWLEEAGEIPVVLSCGRYDGGGWFLQRFNHRWRWHVGGVNCDGGDAPIGQWVHLAGTYDGRYARLFENGLEVASRAETASTVAWPGPLFIGQYGAGPEARFQARARIAGVKVYQRAVPAGELKLASRSAPELRISP